MKLSVRELVEFLLRTGSIDSRFAGFDRANEGARIHRKLQKAAGEGYQAEVFLSETREVDGIPFTIEGRADGIFQSEDGVTVIDEIKTTAIPTDEIQEDGNPCHWAQGMVYGAIYAKQQGLPRLDVRLRGRLPAAAGTHPGRSAGPGVSHHHLPLRHAPGG